MVDNRVCWISVEVNGAVLASMTLESLLVSI